MLQALPDFMPLLAQAAETDLPVARLLTVLVLAIGMLLGLILVCRLQAYVSLLLVSVFVAIGAGMDMTTIGDTIKNGMGKSLGQLATIVGLGSIFGQVLQHSGGAQSLALALHRAFGENRSPLAMILVGFLVSIPVFFDVGLVILAPILVALAKNSGKSILYYGLPLCAAMAVTHACIPPTPGPILVGQNLDVSLGNMILFGGMVALPTALIAGLFSARLGSKIYVAPPEIFEEPDSGGKSVPAVEVILLILLPIGLILGATIAEQQIAKEIPSVTELLPEGDLSEKAIGEASDQRKAMIKQALVESSLGVKLLSFLGHPIVALLITTLATLILLGTLRGTDKNTLMDLCSKALGPAGIIILVTGAGGVFKEILVETQVGKAVAYSLGSMPIFVLAFLLTFIIRVAQGSATVAMIGGSALIASAAAAANMSEPDKALLGVAIACAATMVSHVNDSGFWVVKNYLGMTEKQCLSTFTVITTVIGLVGFTLAWILSMIV